MDMIFFLAPILYLPGIIVFLVRYVKSVRRPESPQTFKFWPVKVLFTIIAPLIGFTRYDQEPPDIPFAPEHTGIVIFMVISSSLAFWLSHYIKVSEKYVIKLLLAAGMLQGIILCTIIFIHFGPWMLMGLAFPVFGFELLAPFMALLLLIHRLYFFSRDYFPERKGFAGPGTVLLICMCISFIQVLAFAGRYGEMDSIVKAFTESRGFVLSGRRLN